MTPAEIRAFRMSLGLSAEAFARAVGVNSGRLVRGWEAGKAVSGPVVRLVEIASEIDGARDWLITRSKKPNSGER